MTAELHPWPKPAGRADEPLPQNITRPCDYSLANAVRALETQLGTIEAYNRLARAARFLKSEIDSGHAKAQHPMFATSTGARND